LEYYKDAYKQYNCAIARYVRQEKEEKTMNQTKCGLKLSVAILFLIVPVCANLQAAFAQNNRNTITFYNQSGDPALVKLIGPTRLQVKVPNGQSRMVNVTAGEYYILARYGNKPEAYRYAKGDPFSVTQTKTRYSAITVTLHKVVGGNYPTHPISAEEFDKTPPDPQIGGRLGHASTHRKFSLMSVEEARQLLEKIIKCLLT
jgi:hypothetical protein